MSSIHTSVILTVHAENEGWIRRAVKSVTTQMDAPNTELIIVADSATPEVEALAHELSKEVQCKFMRTSFSDLGSARNEGIRQSSGKYIAILDGDDAFGYLWLSQANELAKTFTDEDFAIHPEFNIFFGADTFMHRHLSDNDPEFDAKDMCQFNQWSAHVFAPRSLFDRFPYFKAEHGLKYEDFVWNTQTLGAGIKHRVAPGSAHMIRMKLDRTSMAARYVQANGVIPRMDLFDRRDLPNAAKTPEKSRPLPEAVIKQVVFAHREVGERQLILAPDMTIRQYPRARCWNDQAWLRDQIGDASHVVLVDALIKGGAEKYGLDWARAIVSSGERVAIVATSPTASVWLEKAKETGATVIEWKPQTPGLSPEEQAYSLQRALIQCELKSLLVCNSRLGWTLVHANAEPLASKVFAASFATIPLGLGFTACPPFYIKEFAPNLTIVTDNDVHAKIMRDYNGARVEVIKPRCDYAGPNKRSQIDKKHIRVLWAGRGTPEKGVDQLPAIAKALEGVADIHVWGDVKPMNGPENLKYRGPFDGFENIDGSYDVYLMTSINEGMPNTAMEAVMAGLPVVGPEVGGLSELVTMHYRGDASAIAQAVISAATPKTPTNGMELSLQAQPRDRVSGWTFEFNRKVTDLVSPIPEGKIRYDEPLVMPIRTVSRAELAEQYPASAQ